MKWKNNAKISLILFLLTSCNTESSKESRWKRSNAEGAYISRKSDERYPISSHPEKRELPAYPWEK